MVKNVKSPIPAQLDFVIMTVITTEKDSNTLCRIFYTD